MSSYLLLLWAPKAAQAQAQARSPEQVRENVARWHAWGEALAQGGHLVTASQLEAGGRHLTTGGGVADGPFGGAAGHVVGGYFVVTAASLDEATELARGSPLLRQPGGTVEVRPLMGS